MKLIYYADTSAGRFFIGESKDGRYHPIYDDESLGSYHSIPALLDDLCRGHTFSTSNSIDTSTLRIPEEIAEWTLARR